MRSICQTEEAVFDMWPFSIFIHTRCNLYTDQHMSTQNSTELVGLGERLRRLQGERSQEFGALVGLTRSAVANYETERTTPKPSILNEISKNGNFGRLSASGRVRNEYELNTVVAGRGFLNECHDDDKLAMIHVLRLLTRKRSERSSNAS